MFIEFGFILGSWLFGVYAQDFPCIWLHFGPLRIGVHFCHRIEQ